MQTQLKLLIKLKSVRLVSGMPFCVTPYLMIGVYWQTWSSRWTSDPSKMDLLDLHPSVNVVYLSFADPRTTYKRGSKSWATTGLDFSHDFQVVVDAIALLKKRKVCVMLAVGGATYQFNSTPPDGVIALAQDLGVDGLDIDWEPTQGAAQDQEFGPIIQSYKSKLWPNAKLSAAVFSTGAYGKDGSTYVGMNIKGLVSNGSDLDWINIMAYDAGPPPPVGKFDPLGACASYRVYYRGPIMLGFEPGPMAWGGHLLTLAEFQRNAAYISQEDVRNGIFLWSYQKNTAGSPTVETLLDTANTLFPKPSIPIPIPGTPVESKPAETNLKVPGACTIQCPQCDYKIKVAMQ